MSLRRPLTLLLVSSVLACGDDPVELEEEPIASSIEIVPDTLRELRQRGDTIHFDAVVRDQDGEVMEDVPAPGPRWYTEEPEVVKVFALDGIVEARAGGEAWVYAGLGDLRDSVSVEVWPDFSGAYGGPWVVGLSANIGYRCEAEAVVVFEVTTGDRVEGSFSTGEDYFGGNCELREDAWGAMFPAFGKFRGVRTSAEAFEIREFFDLSENGLWGHENHVWEGMAAGDTLRMESTWTEGPGTGTRYSRFGGIRR